MESRAAKIVLRVMAALALAFLYIPLIVVVIYAFNPSVGQRWPLPGFTFKWFSVAWNNGDVRSAIGTSFLVAVTATVLALLIGSAAAFAVHRFRFFGQNAVSFVLLLPIALPGIVTAIALNSSINTFGLPLSTYTIIIGHSTFCIVVVYNNVIARLRRTPTSLVEASMDLGADGWQTFRLVTFPAIRTALVAGALLAFALSWDEIVVTNFVSGTQITVPKWIFDHIHQPRNRPVVNVVGLFLMLLSIIPVYFAQRLAGIGEGAPSLRPAASEPAGL